VEQHAAWPTRPVCKQCKKADKKGVQELCRRASENRRCNTSEMVTGPTCNYSLSQYHAEGSRQHYPHAGLQQQNEKARGSGVVQQASMTVEKTP
jgi:hypothetical protein